MVDETADDGLKLLKYLGLGLTNREKESFKENWYEFYIKKGKDPVQTTWVLYSEVLPLVCEIVNGKSLRGSVEERDTAFGRRLEEKGLPKKLKEGYSLKEILGHGSHKIFGVD